MSPRLRAWLLFKMVEACLFVGRKDRAVELLNEVVREAPRHFQAWGTLGFLHSAAGRYVAAIAAFERALDIRTDDHEVIFNLGFTLQRAGRHEEALARFDRAVAVNAFLDRAWYGAGISLAHLGRMDEAVSRVREATRLQPMNPYAGYQLGAALFKLGRYDEVRAEYERVKGFDPKISEQMRRDFGVL